MQKFFAFALIVLATPLVPWTRADAGMLKCDSKTLSEPDQRRLLKAAKAALPDNKTLQAPIPCRNFGRASAWLETEHWLSAEGAEERWAMRCDRAWRNWSCDSPALLRSGTMALAVDGQERKIDLALNGSIPLADARDLTSRAWSIYQDATAAPKACAPSAHAKDDQNEWAKTRARYPLDATMTELYVTVHSNESDTEIDLFGLGGLSLTFRRDPNDPAVVSVCWSESIVVT